jgi:hypothetical protein
MRLSQSRWSKVLGGLSLFGRSDESIDITTYPVVSVVSLANYDQETSSEPNKHIDDRFMLWPTR